MRLASQSSPRFLFKSSFIDWGRRRRGTADRIEVSVISDLDFAPWSSPWFLFELNSLISYFYLILMLLYEEYFLRNLLWNSDPLPCQRSMSLVVSALIRPDQRWLCHVSTCLCQLSMTAAEQTVWQSTSLICDKSDSTSAPVCISGADYWHVSVTYATSASVCILSAVSADVADYIAVRICHSCYHVSTVTSSSAVHSQRCLLTPKTIAAHICLATSHIMINWRGLPLCKHCHVTTSCVQSVMLLTQKTALLCTPDLPHRKYHASSLCYFSEECHVITDLPCQCCLLPRQDISLSL